MMMRQCNPLNLVVCKQLIVLYLLYLNFNVLTNYAKAKYPTCTAMKRKTNLLECKSDLNLTKIETYLTDESILPTQPKLT